MDYKYALSTQPQDSGKSKNKRKLSSIYMFEYLKYEWKNKHYFLVISLFIPAIIMDFCFFPFFILCHAVMIALTLSRSGEKSFCRILGGKKILRDEHELYLRRPFNAVVEKCRRDGLDLPEEITPFIVSSDAPFAFAVGRHIVLLSEGMMELNEPAFQAIVENQLFRVHKRVPDLIRAVVGSNLITVFVLIPLILYLRFEKRYGGYRVGLFGSIHSDSKDAAILLFLITGCAFCACMIWLSLIQSASKNSIFDADEYTCRCGHGEYLIWYLDNLEDSGLPLTYKLAKQILPGKDLRISRIQRMCRMAA